MKRILMLVCVLTALIGCGAPRNQGASPPILQMPRYVSTATALVPSASNEAFDASLEMGRLDGLGLYEAFVLTVRNKTQQDLEVDWNRTLFIQGNETKGGFMFEGIVYRERHAPKPPTVVFPGATMKKIILPNALVSSPTRHAGWTHDQLEGDVGAYLVVKVGGKEYKEKMMFNVRVVRQQ